MVFLTSPFDFLRVLFIFSRAVKAFAMVLTLETSKTGRSLALIVKMDFLAMLTAWENHPDEVHEKIINPKVQELRSAVGDLLVVMVEHAGGIVED